MKLCLFNVENLFLLDTPPGNVYKKSPDKAEWIARCIQEIDADITMLCEVGGKLNLDYFNSKYLSSNYSALLVEGNSNRGIEMAYLLKKNFKYRSEIYGHANDSLEFNYPFENEENTKLQALGYSKKYPPHKFSRDISELRIIENDKVVLVLLLVHLKSKWDRDGHDFNGCLRREAELKAVVKTYLELKNQFAATPIIIAGDFNGNAQKGQREPEFEELYRSTDLIDVLELMNIPPEHRLSFFHFGRDNQREGSQLDYIFLPKELHHKIKKEESGIYLFRDTNGIPLSYPTDSFQRYALPSDHYPVVASLDFL